MPPHRETRRSRAAATGDGLEEVMLERPALPGEVVIALTDDDCIDLLAADLVVHAENCVRTFGDFHLALSGGAGVESLCRRLMYDPRYRRLPWRRTHLWFVEERCVPFDDERSNHRTIGDLVADHSDIPRVQYHPILAESETGAIDYERQLRDVLAWRERGHDRLDFVLLTAGPGGATAGLVTGGPGLDATTNLICRVPGTAGDGAKGNVTMTLPFINAARFIAVLATGAGAAEIIATLASPGAGAGARANHAMPIGGVAPVGGELRWYLDAAACGAA